MHRLSPFVVVVCSLLLLTSCDRGTAPSIDSEENGLSVSASSGRLVLRSETGKRVHYMPVEEETSTLIDLVYSSAWPSFEDGTEVRIPYGEIVGYEQGDERAIIYWCIFEDATCGDLRVSLR